MSKFEAIILSLVSKLNGKSRQVLENVFNLQTKNVTFMKILRRVSNGWGRSHDFGRLFTLGSEHRFRNCVTIRKKARCAEGAVDLNNGLMTGINGHDVKNDCSLRCANNQISSKCAALYPEQGKFVWIWRRWNCFQFSWRDLLEWNRSSW